MFSCWNNLSRCKLVGLIILTLQILWLKLPALQFVFSKKKICDCRTNLKYNSPPPTINYCLSWCQTWNSFLNFPWSSFYNATSDTPFKYVCVWPHHILTWIFINMIKWPCAKRLLVSFHFRCLQNHNLTNHQFKYS